MSQLSSAPDCLHADISRIIKYAPSELIGREAETKLLSDAWDKVVRGESKRPHVLTFLALGGEGKTSLVSKWAAELAHQDWPGCDAAFAWSFYSQGTREQMAALSDLFLKEALTFFGDDSDKEFAASNAGAFEKGQRLARIVGHQRSLLILDGLEPLQYAPTSPTPGDLKDQGVAALLKGLAAASHGLCVVTTRYGIPDLRAFMGKSVKEEKLTSLSKEAGVALLRFLGVKGTQKEFEKLVEEVKGHALTLNLLGNYLRDAHAGDIRKRDLVKLEDADAKHEHKHHAFHVMDAYVQWMAPTGFQAWLRRLLNPQERETQKERKRALAILRLLGLFDRPATTDCLDALWKGEAIAGLTEPLISISEAQRNLSLKRLDEANLLTINRAEGSGELVALDAHPLLREYFARRVRQKQPKAWRTAHRRLYEHLCMTTSDKKPNPTLEDLQPLHQAVGHGCQAGLQEEARAKVYRDRIQRGMEAYSTKKLGALGSNLGAIACFFQSPWSRVSPTLTETARAWLLNEAAYALRALGRLTEALDPFRAGLAISTKQEAWENSARCANNLSELELTLGDVAGAVEDSEKSVTYADRSGHAAMQMIMRTTHADALHQAGRRAAAEARFREAEQRQAERQPAFSLLYSVQGFQYCDLLLTEAERAAWQIVLWSARAPRAAVGGGTDHTAGEPKAPDLSAPPDQLAKAQVGAREGACAPLIQSCRAVSARVAQTLKWYELIKQEWLLDIALDHLTLGRSALYEAILERSADLRAAATPNDQAAAGSSGVFFPADAAAGHRPALLALQTARRELDAALDGLRRSGNMDDLPRGLLTRAWCSFSEAMAHRLHDPQRWTADCERSAQSDLDEAWEIAERGPMKLFLADIHLHRARLFRDREELKRARALIEQCGYWRRKQELEDAEEAVRSW